MSGIKGYSTQKKSLGKIDGYTDSQSQDVNEFVTTSKTSSDKILLDSKSMGAFRVNLTPNTVAVGSTTRILNVTAHGAKKGDFVKFETSAANSDYEAGVLSIPDANTILIDGVLPQTPVVGDQLYILRYVTPRLDSTGSPIVTTSSGPVQYNLNSVATQVSEDTVAPANNRFLPVRVLNPATGNAINFATEVTQAANGVLIGSVTETAPASDTASSGLNGRLQRVAQRLSSLIALLPVSLGQKTSAGSLAVVVSSDQSAIPVSGPLTDVQLRATAVPVSGPLTDAQLRASVVPVTDAANGVLLGAVTETAPASDTASSGLNGRLQRVAQRLTSLIGLFPATLGQKTMANSFAVTLASDQAAIPVTTSISDVTSSGSITTQNLNPNSGAATAASTVAVSLNGQNTVTIQVTGTYTGALTPQVTVDGSNWIAATGLYNVNTGAISTSIASTAVGVYKLEVAGSAQFRISANAAVTGTAVVSLRASNATGTVAIEAPLPTGSNIIGALSANQSTNVAQINGVAPLMGNGVTGTGSLRVTLASDTTTNTNPLLFKQGGKTVSATVRNDYTTTSVTTGAWVQLVASLGAAVTEMEIFDSSGQTLEIGTGAAASETRLVLVFPGGNGRIPVAIASATRISIRAVSANASVGEIDINFYN